MIRAGSASDLERVEAIQRASPEAAQWTVSEFARRVAALLPDAGGRAWMAVWEFDRKAIGEAQAEMWREL